jgi:hypothetical protein
LRDLYPSRPLGLRGGIQTSLCMDCFVTLFFSKEEIWYRGVDVA